MSKDGKHYYNYISKNEFNNNNNKVLSLSVYIKRFCEMIVINGVSVPIYIGPSSNDDDYDSDLTIIEYSVI